MFEKIRNNFYFWLLLIILLAGLLRFPGIFWGYHFFGGRTKVALHTDEMYGVNLTNQFLKKQIDLDEGYPRAQAFQVFLLAWPMRKFLKLPFIIIFYLGRLHSLFFGLLLVFLSGFVARSIFKNDEIGLLTAFFVATSDVAVTYSHIFIPDISATFCFFLSLYLGYLFWKNRGFEYLTFNAAAAGGAFAFKFNPAGFLTAILCAFASKKKFVSVFLVILVFAGSFYLLNGASFTWKNFFGAERYFAIYNKGQGSFPLVLNILLIPLNLLVAVGLPVFLLFVAGLFLILKKLLSKEIFLNSPLIIVFGSGFIFFFLFIFTFKMLPVRMVLPLVPLVVLVASWAFYQIKFLVDNKKWLIPVLFCYQLLYTAPAQANFIFEPRLASGRWLRQNVPAGEKISVSAQAFIPPEYQTTFKMDQNFLVLAEQGYERYLTKNGLNYKITGQLPELWEIYNPNLEYGDDPLILQKILTGKTSYKLVAQFDTFTLTPEWAFWKWLGYHPSLLGKVLIYKKEAGKNLVTPSVK